MEYANNTMNVIVFEGLVKVCNLAGVCVMAKAGQMTSVRSGDNSAPLPPQQATLDLLVASGSDTDPGAQRPAGRRWAAPWRVGNGGNCGRGGRNGIGCGIDPRRQQAAREWVHRRQSLLTTPG